MFTTSTENDDKLGEGSLVRDDPKLLDDGGERPVGGSIPRCEISSLLDKKNLPGGQLPPVLWRWHVDHLSQKIK